MVNRKRRKIEKRKAREGKVKQKLSRRREYERKMEKLEKEAEDIENGD
jgi:hypothetical protein